jgi:hypothetical protein
MVRLKVALRVVCSIEGVKQERRSIGEVRGQSFKSLNVALFNIVRPLDACSAQENIGAKSTNGIPPRQPTGMNLAGNMMHVRIGKTRWVKAREGFIDQCGGFGTQFGLKIFRNGVKRSAELIRQQVAARHHREQSNEQRIRGGPPQSIATYIKISEFHVQSFAGIVEKGSNAGCDRSNIKHS